MTLSCTGGSCVLPQTSHPCIKTHFYKPDCGRTAHWEPSWKDSEATVGESGNPLAMSALHLDVENWPRRVWLSWERISGPRCGEAGGTVEPQSLELSSPPWDALSHSPPGSEFRFRPKVFPGRNVPHLMGCHMSGKIRKEPLTRGNVS